MMKQKIIATLDGLSDKQVEFLYYFVKKLFGIAE